MSPIKSKKISSVFPVERIERRIYCRACSKSNRELWLKYSLARQNSKILAANREFLVGRLRHASSKFDDFRSKFLNFIRALDFSQALRGQKVMLDSDLAVLYGVPTRVLNQAVRRNLERFPNDFMFQLNKKEFKDWISQIVISNPGAKMGLRKSPLAFTEQGIAMLSSVLKSERAVRINILIIRTFVKLRQLLANHKHLADKIAAIEKIQKEHGKSITEILVIVDKLLQAQQELPPAIGFTV